MIDARELRLGNLIFCKTAKIGVDIRPSELEDQEFTIK